ncbi:MAG: TauD/TfdA family dioxygenase [Proteobacteria bacterium]|nr:TauD/TfdA family dioxygenase [Pseudomonadota bacterium]
MAAEQLIVPDFDTYPVTHALEEAWVIDGGVKLRWDDGLESRLPVLWLREFSPDISTFHAITREQMIKLTEIPADLIASEATIAQDGFLSVLWEPESLSSRYHPGWLRAHIPDTPDAIFALPERQLWRDADHKKATWFDGNAVREGRHGVFKEWVEAIHIHGVGLLRGLPAEPAIIPEIPDLIGPVRTTNFGSIYEVINRPDANSNAFTAIALAAHTDLATREYVPGLQFLFCLVNDVVGGNSILADGFSIAEQLKQESAEFYEVLSTVAIPFGTKDKNSDYRYTAPVLEHDCEGKLSALRYTYWLRSPMSGSFDTITTFYAAFRRLQEIANDPANQIDFRLNPGEMMAFDNRRILHGRAAFDPASGKRLLRGCYGEREDLESCLRILNRKERKRAATSRHTASSE